MKQPAGDQNRTNPASVIGPRWLRDQAWPLWLEYGIDRTHRAFHEHLDDSLVCDAGFRRLRVAARQTYVFAVAARHGMTSARPAVWLGIDFLKQARLTDGGYAWRFDLDNRVIDGRRDLYDYAFVLLALAAAAPLAGAGNLRRDADDLADFMTARLVHPGEGFEESIPASQPRRQNPHMHLLEAMLAAHDAFGGERFFREATRLVDLFARRFFQAADGALAEFFHDDLSPLREAGRCYEVEPGHHYEWVWLLDLYERAARAGGAPVPAGLREASDALLGFADRHAVNPQHGRAVDGLWSDGTLRQGSVRLWPQTERLKAEARRTTRAQQGVAAALRALDRHVRNVSPGLWIERMDADGAPLPGPAPASSLYHLTAALTDPAVVRLCGDAETAGSPSM